MRRTLFAPLCAALLLAGCAPLAPTGRMAPGTSVIVVRHAERAADATASDPELSDAGKRRAEALADALADAGVGTILVTQYRRTRMTAEPLAARGAIPIDVVETGAAGVAAHVAAVHAAVLERRAAGAVLVVGHSNTVPAIVRRLSGRAVPDMSNDEYGTMYVVLLPAPGHVTDGGARLLRARF